VVRLCRSGRNLPRDAGHHRRARHRVALWREPHQKAALYLPKGPAAKGIANAVQVQGKELSYNNYNDADAALELVAEFRDAEPTVVIVKHANPCGVATAPRWSRPMRRRSNATRSARSAASSP
jgi:phosphoribosylaminoimidazolecarboxamide formyltransferase/IMP cyclohydrolase